VKVNYCKDNNTIFKFVWTVAVVMTTQQSTEINCNKLSIQIIHSMHSAGAYWLAGVLDFERSALLV